MWNPFRQKVIGYNLSAQGLKRWFKVRTADGNEYETIREDRIWTREYWPRKHKATIHRVRAIDIMELGIKEAIWIDGGTTAVQPISVVQYKEEVIQLLETWSELSVFDQPTLEWDEKEITAVKITNQKGS